MKTKIDPYIVQKINDVLIVKPGENRRARFDKFVQYLLLAGLEFHRITVTDARTQ